MTREEAIAWCDRFNNAWANANQDDDFPDLKYSDTLDKLFYLAGQALRQQERFGEANKSLTMDELSERNAPVFLPIKDFPNGGYWCLCENGYIIPPSGHGFMAKERPNWVFYSQKPEGGTV